MSNEADGARDSLTVDGDPTELELRRLLVEWNDTASPIPGGAPCTSSSRSRRAARRTRSRSSFGASS